MTAAHRADRSTGRSVRTSISHHERRPRGDRGLRLVTAALVGVLGMSLPTAVIASSNANPFQELGGQEAQAWWTPTGQNGTSRHVSAGRGGAAVAISDGRSAYSPESRSSRGQRSTPLPLGEAAAPDTPAAGAPLGTGDETTSPATSPEPASSVSEQGATPLTDPLQPGSGSVFLSGERAVVNGERYTVQSPERPWSLSVYPTQGYSRFELRPGDVWENDARLHPDGRQRVSMRGQTFWPENTDVWFSYALRTSGLPATWTQLTSLRQDLESGETPGKPDPFSLIVRNGQLLIETRSDTRALTTSQVDQVARYTMPMFEPNTWQNIVVRVAFDPHGNGRLTFWLNGVQRYDSGAIPIGYNDQRGPYFKYGLYRGGSDQTSVAEFANVEIGTSSLLGRVTDPLPLPR